MKFMLEIAVLGFSVTYVPLLEIDGERMSMRLIFSTDIEDVARAFILL